MNAVLTSTLRVYDDADPARMLLDTTDRAEITRTLNGVGVRFERWAADAAIASDATPADVLAAYADDVARLRAECGYEAADVIRLAKGAPNTAPMREKFLDEHTHSEDEVRFFVEGSGAFYLRIGGRVHQMICTRGDLISVPAGTTHWFDMGPDPEFTAIRLFTDASGWVAQFTGDPIARRFPLYE
ncbi:MAG TPA: cupin domain-containing protein [Candidatus Sulfotelmatobacter sp.]|nr:cupin domain-containing protein [Candidatus Sulfotelmatobacter sp.]